jgi:hypothetical protein
MTAGDLDFLRSGTERWSDRIPAGVEFFGPLWPAGVPAW